MANLLIKSQLIHYIFIHKNFIKTKIRLNVFYFIIGRTGGAITAIQML